MHIWLEKFKKYLNMKKKQSNNQKNKLILLILKNHNNISTKNQVDILIMINFHKTLQI